MRKTGIAVLCSKCAQEFEIFSDDGAGDETAIWNWCPHCGAQNQFWIRFMYRKLGDHDEIVPLGISSEEAKSKFPKGSRKQVPDIKMYYKIRNKRTGLFSRGGTTVSSTNPFNWNKDGKVWKTKSSLGAHLSQYINYSRYNNTLVIKIPKDWEVVEIEPVIRGAESAKDYATKTSPKIKDYNRSNKERIDATKKKEEEQKRKEEERKKNEAFMDSIKITGV